MFYFASIEICNVGVFLRHSNSINLSFAITQTNILFKIQNFKYPIILIATVAKHTQIQLLIDSLS